MVRGTESGAHTFEGLRSSMQKHYQAHPRQYATVVTDVDSSIAIPHLHFFSSHVYT
eukprot:m.411438 g.411438  ORF g.411438 m.411438 type:complete len:56 (-) comp28655_c0_seq1:40-207(-)